MCNFKKTTFIVFILTLPFILLGQDVTTLKKIDELLKLPPLQKTSLVQNISENVVFVEVNFAISNFVNEDDLKLFHNREIEKVELVFTQYSSDPLFSQEKLNKNRLIALYQVMPEIFNDPFIQWETIEITKCKNKEEAENQFHGFVFHLRDSKQSLHSKEMSMTGSWLHQIQSVLPNIKIESKKDKITEEINTFSTEKRKTIQELQMEEISLLMDDFKALDLKSLSQEELDELLDELKKKIEYILRPEKLIGVGGGPGGPGGADWDENDVCYLFYDTSQVFMFIDDWTVYEVLNRNYDKWNNILVVSNVTVGMTLFNVQLLSFFSHEPNKFRQFTFYNYGDKKENSLKILGETGGIYTTETIFKDNVFNSYCEAVTARNLDAIYESNEIEVLKSVIQKNPNQNDIVLIADITSTIKDMILIDEITKPIHIIACPSKEPIKTDYLNLIYHSKGSLHTLDKDYLTIYKIRNGESVTIGKWRYKLSDNKFVLINN
jgi:uncharacterized protein (DUF2267 family)